MVDAAELTHIADRLRQRRPTQAERNAIAKTLDAMAERMNPPKPKAAKPKTIEQAVQQLDDPPVEEDAPESEPAPISRATGKPKRSRNASQDG